MKHIKLYEDFVNEEAKPEILVKLFKELAKAKNVESVIWGLDKSEEFPHIVHFKNGLESQADRHEGEMEEFSFYLNDDGIKTADIHKWIVGQSYQVGKRFPATKAKTRQEKIDIILDPAFQQAYTNYHQTYFEDLQRQWEGMCNSNLPSRGVTPESTKEYKEDLFDALEAWTSRENGILDAIKEIGFESFAANEIMGIRHKKSLKLKRKY